MNVCAGPSHVNHWAGTSPFIIFLKSTVSIVYPASRAAPSGDSDTSRCPYVVGAGAMPFNSSRAWKNHAAHCDIRLACAMLCAWIATLVMREFGGARCVATEVSANS